LPAGVAAGGGDPRSGLRSTWLLPHLLRDVERRPDRELRAHRPRLRRPFLISGEKPMLHVNTKFDRPDPALVERLSAYSSATIHEAQGRLGALSSKIKPVDDAMSLCGPAFTVLCTPRDNIMLQVAIAHAKPGDVIVVSAGEYAEAGSFGDVL